jgi:hypothetical protein
VASVNSGLGSEGALDLDRKVGKGQDSEEYGEVCVGGGAFLKTSRGVRKEENLLSVIYKFLSFVSV